MSEHMQALRHHISDLNHKDYSALPELKTLEFVLMFVPIDAAFVAALQCEEKLMAEMYSNRIIIVTPTTLLATLKTIEHIWQLERQNQNALEIAGKAGQLYDKLCGFLDDMEKLGKQLDTCRDSYDKAMKKISTGRGNLISQAEALPKLGVHTKKNISRSLLETAGND